MMVTPLLRNHWYISDVVLPLYMQYGFMRATSMPDVTAAFTM
jgi:hypothetical protein